MADHALQATTTRAAGPRAPARSLLDLIWKIDYRNGMWSASLRNDPSVVVTTGSGDKLAQITRDLTIAILGVHGSATRRAVTAATAA
jgi:hypothetical protein